MSLISLIRNKPGFGYRKDPVDTRDVLLRSKLGAERIPESAGVFGVPLVIKNQFSTSSCVGHAVAQAIRIAYSLSDHSDGTCPDLSSLFAYYNARKESGDPILDRGTHIRSAIKAAQKLGVCNELVWPFSTLKVNRMPDWSSYRGAHDRRGIRGYYRIDNGDLDSIRAAIAMGHPVVAGWLVNQSFVDYRGEGSIGAMTSPFVGGHAMVIGAYSSSECREWTILNSWGTGWGRMGFASVRSSFIREAMDVWAVDV